MVYKFKHIKLYTNLCVKLNNGRGTWKKQYEGMERFNTVLSALSPGLRRPFAGELLLLASPSSPSLVKGNDQP